jgi:hypothetical protein
MLDRQMIETILMRRFPGSSPSQVAAAANGIMSLTEDWEEVSGVEPLAGCDGHASIIGPCRPSEVDLGGEVRVFRRRVR